MKITSIELEQDIDDKIRTYIINYFEKYGVRPSVIIISKPLMNWFKHTLMEKARYANEGTWKPELNCQLMTFEGLTLFETFKENIIEVF
ncbi:MAG TPA: hypothetical protein ENG37_01935 [Firmicutes bacterium]|nr:hypothetical protein [Bacillota bacterium]